jgi:hypothetical protein
VDTKLDGVDDRLVAEVTARQNADAAEVAARQGGDQAEATARANADQAETTARTNADTTLDGKITNEATARANGDQAEATARTNADNAESPARNAADVGLGNRTTALEARPRVTGGRTLVSFGGGGAQPGNGVLNFPANLGNVIAVVVSTSDPSAFNAITSVAGWTATTADLWCWGVNNTPLVRDMYVAWMAVYS